MTLIASGPGLLVVHPSVPAKNVKELIALAKSKPGQLIYASAGNGTPPHLAAELFKSMAGVDLVHIPYKGNVPAFVDLLTGAVSLSFPTITSGLPLVRSGKLRALGVTSKERSTVVPEVPTIAESGLPGLRSDHMVRHAGARANENADRRETARPDGRSAQASGHSTEAARAGSRASRKHTRGVCRHHFGGAREMEQSGCGGGRKSGVRHVLNDERGPGPVDYHARLDSF